MGQDREYVLKFCDALTKILGVSRHDLSSIIEQLTRANVLPWDASWWTLELLRSEPYLRAAPLSAQRRDRLRLPRRSWSAREENLARDA